MSKKVFLGQNWMLVFLLIGSLLFQTVEELIPLFISIIIILKVLQGLLFITKTLIKKHFFYFIIIFLIALFFGWLPLLFDISSEILLYGILALEVFVHAVDAFLQYRRGDKTWFINGVIAIAIIVFIIGSFFYTDISFVISFFFEIIALSAIYYLYSYYRTGNIPGNYTLLNINNAIFRDAFVPKKVYSEFMNATDATIDAVVQKYSYYHQEREVDLNETLTVYMHTWKPGLDMMGHCDLSFRGTSFTLSNYDVERSHFDGMVTSGTIGIGEMKAYINFCTDIKDKLVFGYTLSLSQKQADAIARELDIIQGTMTTLWEPKDIKKNKAADEILKHIPNFTIRKVIQGPFRNYFVLGTNCAKLVDVILNEAGIQTKVSKNLLTPGEYMSILDKDKEKRVIEKRVYWKAINHENVR